MKIIFIFGSTAVGKMTVGQELLKITDLRLYHNHIMLEPILEIFGGMDGEQNEHKRRILSRLRNVILEEFAASEHYGLIVTGMLSMGNPNWEASLAPILKIFEQCNANFYYVELFASQEVRLQRNVTENRLKHKASKRDIAVSNQRLINDDAKYCYSTDGQITIDNYVKIDNSDLTPDVVAYMIKEKFSL
ncbi:MAG: AAA family ATPase [Defluviitaleaceae bacterium]|nr:AAA family ATPase [Defluviitaleaceae bacterium]